MESEIENIFVESFSDHDEKLDVLEKRWEELGLSKGVETFAQSISGTMNMSVGVFRYQADNFSGDIVFFDKNFIASGSCRWRNLSRGWENIQTWSMEYDSLDDSITLNIGPGNAKIASVSRTTSDANLRFDISQKKVIFVVRQKIPFPGDLKLHVGSNMVIQG